jgi:hypothetical protein
VDQLRQPVDVVGLERLHEAGEQLAVRIVQGRSRIVQGRPNRLERGPRPLEGAVHGSDARLEQLGDLARLPAQHFAEDQDRALARR